MRYGIGIYWRRYNLFLRDTEILANGFRVYQNWQMHHRTILKKSYTYDKCLETSIRLFHSEWFFFCLVIVWKCLVQLIKMRLVIIYILHIITYHIIIVFYYRYWQGWEIELIVLLVKVIWDLNLRSNRLTKVY